MPAIVRLIIPILRIAGRWLVRRALTKGIRKVAAFIELRIETFKERLAKAKTKRRKAWLRFRISWREKVLAFLEEHRADLTHKSLRLVDRAVDELDEKIPDQPPRDTWREWARQQ